MTPPKTQCTTRGPRLTTLLCPRRSEPPPPAPRPRQWQSGAEHAGPLKLSSERNRWLAMLSPAQETRRPCSPLAAAAARAFPCCCGKFARSGAPDQSKGAAFARRRSWRVRGCAFRAEALPAGSRWDASPPPCRVQPMLRQCRRHCLVLRAKYQVLLHQVLAGPGKLLLAPNAACLRVRGQHQILPVAGGLLAA